MEPNNNNNLLPTIYYNDSKGNKWQWTIITTDDNTIITTSGRVGGKLRPTTRKITAGKRKTDLKAKAFDEALSRWKAKQQEVTCKQNYSVMLGTAPLGAPINI